MVPVFIVSIFALMNSIIKRYLDLIKERYGNLLSDELSPFFEMLTVSQVGSKHYYIEAGTIQSQIGYVHSGLVRAFYVDEKGNEVTVNFIKEGEYATHYPALRNGQPSKFYFQCLEPSIIINIPYNHLIKYCDESKYIERYLRLTLEEVFEQHLNRVEGFIFDNADQRYLNFIKTNPDLFNRISISDLSSYLGIERQTLTRIRKRILNK